MVSIKVGSIAEKIEVIILKLKTSLIFEMYIKEVFYLTHRNINEIFFIFISIKHLD